MLTRHLFRLCIIATLWPGNHPVMAQNLPIASVWLGTKTLYVHPQAAPALAIGHVSFQPSQADSDKDRSAQTLQFSLHIDHSKFKDFFLSMKEFKCLESARELMCHVPYPYKHAGTIRLSDSGKNDDFAWLEHSLLFMFKQPSEFGAKLWNGVYFKFSRSTEGQKLIGQAQAVDLNRISAPPEKPEPPYRPALRDDIPAGARWIEKISIE